MHQLFNNEKFDELRNACRFFGFSSIDTKESVIIPTDVSEKVDKLIEKRNNARMSKNFSLADKIREDLLSAGITIKDSGQETTWESSQKLNIKKLKEL
jgi:cysteinyl-tRNA synthetase